MCGEEEGAETLLNTVYNVIHLKWNRNPAPTNSACVASLSLSLLAVDARIIISFVFIYEQNICDCVCVYGFVRIVLHGMGRKYWAHKGYEMALLHERWEGAVGVNIGLQSPSNKTTIISLPPCCSV